MNFLTGVVQSIDGHLYDTRFSKHDQQILQSKLSGKVSLLNNKLIGLLRYPPPTYKKNPKGIYKVKRKSSVNNNCF